jgi:hypothetical protein
LVKLKKGKSYQLSYHHWAYIFDITEDDIIYLDMETEYFNSLCIVREPMYTINKGDTIFKTAKLETLEGWRYISTIFGFPWEKIYISI